MRCQVNRDLLPVKITYFTLFAGIGILLPYIAVYMRQLGLSPAESAIILSISTIITAAARSAIGLAADKHRKHVIILIACCVLTGVAHFSLLFVPRESHEAIHAYNNVSYAYSSCASELDGDILLCGAFSTVSGVEASMVSLPSVESISGIKHSSNKSLGSANDCEMQCCSSDTSALLVHLPNDSHVMQNVCEIHMLSSAYVTRGQCDLYHSKSDSLNTSNSLFALQNLCSSFNNLTCSVTCRPQSIQVVVSSKFGRTFCIFFILYLIASCSFSPIISIVDGLSYACLGENRAKFGHQRLWGSVGFGLFGVASSMIMDVLQTSETDKNYTYSYILFVVFLLATTFSVYHIRASVEVIAGSLMSNVRKILCNLELDLLLLTAFVSGFLCGAQEGFLYWYLQSLGGPQVLLGFCGLVQCSIEILILFYSGAVVVKFGTMLCLCAVFAAFGLRFLLYSFLVNPWCVLSIEPLHSICYGLFYPAMSMRASELTPVGMHATVQSFLGTLYMSIGRAVGVAVGGVLYEQFGPRTMFRAFSTVSFSYISVLVICMLLMKGRRQSSAAIETIGEENGLTAGETLSPLEATTCKVVDDELDQDKERTSLA